MSTVKVDTIQTTGGASEIAIDKLKGVSSVSSISVVGEGGTTTTDLQQGLLKSWVNFDGSATDAAARDSFNVSGMTDNSTGNYSVAFGNDFNNAFFATSCAAGDFSGTDDAGNNQYVYNFATGSIRMSIFHYSNGGSVDISVCTLQQSGDLA